MMNRKKFSMYIVVFILSILVINLMAVKFYWYFSIWWFDMVMHFLGGFWIGLLFIWLFSSKAFSFLRLSFEEINIKFIARTILFVLIIGVYWEAFEIVINNIIVGDKFNILDTLSDVFFDLAGGCFAIIYFSKKVLLKIENKL